MLYKLPKLGDAELEVMSLIRDQWRNMRYALQQQPRKWRGVLARTLRAKAVQGSNSIEGYVVSGSDALAAVDGDEPTEASPSAWINVVHYREAMDYVLRLATAPDFAYSSDLIRSLHFVMMRHNMKANPGTWRPGAIYVRNSGTNETVYEAPPIENVPALTKELWRELMKHQTKGVLRAAIAHLNLVLIHPFSDGNGRMSRCLQTLALARAGIADPTFSSIEEYLGQNTQAYYDVLAEVGGGSWKPERDTRPWIRFCFTAHYRQAETVKTRIDRTGQIALAVEEAVSGSSLPMRVVTALVNAALGERLRNSSYRQQADGVSQVVASRDLKAICEEDWLTAHGEKRGRYYEAAPRLTSLAQRFPKGGKIPDPFDLV